MNRCMEPQDHLRHGGLTDVRYYVDPDLVDEGVD